MPITNGTSDKEKNKGTDEALASVNDTLPVSSYARILPTMTSDDEPTAPPSEIRPADSNPLKINLIKKLKNIKTKVNEPGFSYQLQFNEKEIDTATKDSVIEVKVVDQSGQKKLGVFNVQQDKISSYDDTKEVAIAMMRAYMEANPGQPMKIKPRNKKAQQSFVEAATILKPLLDKIGCTILGVGDVKPVRIEKQVAANPVKENPVPEEVEPASSVKMPEKQLRAIGDGNCAFNAFALELRQVKENAAGLEISKELAEFFEKHNEIFNLQDGNEFQRQLAPILRKKSCDLALENKESNAHTMEEALCAAFDLYVSHQDAGKDDDIFLQFEFIKKKFGSLRESNIENKTDELKKWWKQEGYGLFLSEIGKDGVYAGDLELVPLAAYFKVNLEVIAKTDNSESHLSYLTAHRLDCSHVEDAAKLFLHEQGIIDQSKLFATLEKEKLKGFIDQYKGYKEKDSDNNIVKQLGSVLTKGSDGVASMIEQLSVLNDNYSKHPVVCLEHKGAHWDVQQKQNTAQASYNKPR